MFRRLLAQQGPSKRARSSDPDAASLPAAPQAEPAVEETGEARAAAMARRGGSRARARGEAEAEGVGGAGEEAAPARPADGEAADAEDDVVDVSEDAPDAAAAPGADAEAAGAAPSEKEAGHDAIVAKEPLQARLENRGTPSAFSPLPAEAAGTVSASTPSTSARPKPAWVTAEEAIAAIFSSASRLETAEVPLLEALGGAALAEDIFAVKPIPSVPVALKVSAFHAGGVPHARKSSALQKSGCAFLSCSPGRKDSCYEAYFQGGPCGS